MNNLFTIVIPTYNRCEMLKESLEMVLPQVRKCKEDVRLFISDNSSTDGTQELVEHYLQTNGDILQYHRQLENIGAQANFRYAVRNVQSKYVCLLGDDDVVFPNYVETVVEILRKHPDVGLVNYNVLTVDYSLNNARLRQADIMGIQPIVYESGRNLIYDHLEIPSLISSNVFKREAFVKVLDTISVGTYPGYDWFAALYKSCLNTKCVFIGLPILLQRMPSEQRWQKDSPWYVIYGLGKLFRELDVDIPGLQERWGLSFYVNRQSWYKFELGMMSKHKELYRDRYDKMLEYISRSDSRKTFRLYMKYSTSYAEFLEFPFYVLRRRTKNALACIIKKIIRK